MCGFFTVISKRKVNLNLFEFSFHKMNYRGPDNSDIFKFESKEFNYYSGNHRLSIVDFDKNSNLPFISNCKNYVISYNGEIYNHREIKLNLEKDFTFRTNSDTEVIINSYIKFGEKFYKKINGMFALCIFDLKKKEVIFGRDSVGIKPLYSYKKDDLLILSSEIDPIIYFLGQSSFEAECLDEFLLNGFLSSKKTGHQNIEKILPNSIFKIDANFFISQKNNSRFRSNNFNVNDFENLFSKNVSFQSEAKAKTCLAFSGGVDSSLIGKFLPSGFPAFYVKNSENNNTKNVQNLAKKYQLDLKIININEKVSFNENINFVAKNTQELISDFTFYNTYKLSKSISDHGYKVILSGMGADELFGGYPRSKYIKYKKFFDILIKLIFLFKLDSSFLNKNKISRYLSIQDTNEFRLYYSYLIGYFNKSDLNNLLKNNSNYHKFDQVIYNKNLSDLKNSITNDIKGYLLHNLTIADHASMLASVEIRVPFLSEDLIHYALSLNDDDLIFLFIGKFILKSNLIQNLDFKNFFGKKSGFNPPLNSFIDDKKNFNFFREILLEGSLKNYFNMKKISKLLEDHKKNNIHTYKIWQLSYFSLWLNNYDY